MLALAIFPGTGHACLVEMHPPSRSLPALAEEAQGHAQVPGDVRAPHLIAIPNGVRPYLHHACDRLYDLEELEGDLYSAAAAAMLSRRLHPIIVALLTCAFI